MLYIVIYPLLGLFLLCEELRDNYAKKYIADYLLLAVRLAQYIKSILVKTKISKNLNLVCLLVSIWNTMLKINKYSLPVFIEAWQKYVIEFIIWSFMNVIIVRMKPLLI